MESIFAKQGHYQQPFFHLAGEAVLLLVGAGYGYGYTGFTDKTTGEMALINFEIGAIF